MNKLIKITIIFYVALILSFLLIHKDNVNQILSIFILIHILIVYIVSYPDYKYISYHYIIGIVSTLFLFKDIIINFNVYDLTFLIIFLIIYLGTLLLKNALFSYRMNFIMHKIAKQLRPIITERFHIEDKVNLLKKENLELEFQKMIINKIYNQVKIINATLEFDDIIDLSQKILIDIVGVDNFILYIRENDGHFREAARYNLNNSMREYLRYIIKTKGDDFFNKVSNYLRLDVDSNKKNDEFTNIHIFPFVLQNEILGILILFSNANIKLDELIINNIKITSRYISMGIKKSLLYKRVQELSQKDGLTSLYLRRFFEKLLEEEFTRVKRYKNKLSLIMLDIDHFKDVNDTYGHLFGDKVLTMIAGIILDNIKKPITASRYGGEEFIIICPDCGEVEAKKLAEKIRVDVENTIFLNNAKKVKVTISGGVAEYKAHIKKKENLIEHADKNLYKAKTLSRNRIV